MSFSHRIRTLGVLVVAPAVVALGVDAGSVTLTRISVPEQVRESGYAAAVAVEHMQVSSRTASIALRAATDKGRSRGLRVRPATFRLHRDGRVQVTGTKTAPTVILQRVKPLRHFTRVSATATVAPLPFS
jgi:hypothetical protein